MSSRRNQEGKAARCHACRLVPAGCGRRPRQVSWLAALEGNIATFRAPSSFADSGLAAYSCGHSAGFGPASLFTDSCERGTFGNIRARRRRRGLSIAALPAMGRGPFPGWSETSRTLRKTKMKTDAHPDYHMIKVQMTDGTVFETRSTWGKAGDTLQLDIDPKVHPAWTGGHNRMVDSGGQGARFNNRSAGLRRGKRKPARLGP